MSANRAVSSSQFFKISGWGYFFNKTPNDTSLTLTVCTALSLCFLMKLSECNKGFNCNGQRVQNGGE